MSESVARSGNKTLYVARSVVELLSQCVVFMAFAAMIILGVVKKSDEYILYATLVTIPVVITFFCKKIYKVVVSFCNDSYSTYCSSNYAWKNRC